MTRDERAKKLAYEMGQMMLDDSDVVQGAVLAALVSYWVKSDDPNEQENRLASFDVIVRDMLMRGAFPDKEHWR